MSLWLVDDQRDHVLTVPAIASHRVESWTWRVLDRRGNMTGVLDGVTGGSLEMNVHDDTRHKGSLSWTGRAESMPVWDEIRVQPVYSVRFADGTTDEWTMGVYLPTVPTMTHDDAGNVSAQVALFDKTLVLRQQAIEADQGYPAGTNATAIAHDFVSDGLNPTGTPYSQRDLPVFDDSAETLRSPVTWEIGTSSLTIINEALAAAGFFAVWADGNGTLRSTPYVAPLDRPLTFAFEAGRTAIHRGEFTRTVDLFDAPNHVIGISRGDGDTEALVRTAVDLDSDSPLSYQRRGRWVTLVREGIEATSGTVLQGIVNRALTEAQDRAATLEIEHAPAPLAGNARVRFVSGTVAADAVVQAYRVECKPGALWRTTLREVRS